MAETIHRDEVVHVVASGPLTVAAWWNPPARPQIQALSRANEAQRQRYGDRAALANLVADSDPRLPNELREAAAMIAEHGDSGAAAAHVVLVRGLPGVAIRTFFSSMRLVARPRVPTRVFDDREEAARWLAGILRRGDPSWSAARVSAVFDRALKRGA